jgi:microcystin-dependent protein
MTDFDSVEETGGAKTHTLTENEMPSHTHSYINSSSSSRNTGQPGADNVGVVGALTGSTGGDQAHNNMQPFIVTYMWKRTA